MVLSLTTALILTRQSGSSYITLTMNGLVDDVAEIGNHAATTVSFPTGVTAWISQTWGVGSFGDTTLGTASNPTTLINENGETLHWQAEGDNGQSYRASAPIYYPAPVAAGALSNQSLDQDSGDQTYDVSGDFTFSGTGAYSVTAGPSGVTVAEGTGVVTFDTDVLATQTNTAITIRLEDTANTARFDESSFNLTISDVTAPVLTSPVDNANGSDAYTGSVSTDEANGTLYHFVSTSGTPPNATDLKAGTGATASGSQTVSATGAQAVSGSGLSDGTDYWIHYLHTDAAGNDSTISSADGFTTGDVTAPALSGATAAADGATAATASVTTDEGDGTLYTVTSTSSTKPSVAQIQAGQDHTGAAAPFSGSQAVSSTGSQAISPAPSGLTAETAYFQHFQQEDSSGNDSTVVTSASFTTAASDTTAPAISGDSYTNTTQTLAFTLTEASGTATVVWATADTAEDPTYTIGGGWAGTTYETGSYTAETGANSDVISITGTTPDGARELTVYAYDASNNLSTVSRYSITVDNTAPTFSSGSPADNATGVSVGSALALTFSENVVAAASGGEFYLYDDIDTTPVLVETFDVDAGTGDNGGTIAIVTDTVTITPGANLDASTQHSVRWNAGAIEDTYGNAILANTGDTTYNFTTATASTSASVAQRLTGYSDTATVNAAATLETSSITIGSGSNRGLLAMISMAATANSGDLSSCTATFGTAARSAGTGTAMTVVGAEVDGGRRSRIMAFGLASPSTGAGTVQITANPDALAAAVVRIWEVEDADQTLGNWISASNTGTGVTSLSANLTTTEANQLVLSGLTLLSGDYTGELSITGGMTQGATSNTGTTGFSDVTSAFAEESPASAASDAGGWSWSTSTDAVVLRIGIPGA